MTAATKDQDAPRVFDERPMVRVSKQERMLYGDDAALIRRLGDAAQALEEARSIAERFLDECVTVDGYGDTAANPKDDAGRSAETRRYLAICKRVAEVEQSARRLFGAVAAECADEKRKRWEAEPSTGADAVNAPEMVVAK